MSNLKNHQKKIFLSNMDTIYPHKLRILITVKFFQ